MKNQFKFCNDLHDGLGVAEMKLAFPEGTNIVDEIRSQFCNEVKSKLIALNENLTKEDKQSISVNINGNTPNCCSYFVVNGPPEQSAGLLVNVYRATREAAETMCEAHEFPQFNFEPDFSFLTQEIIRLALRHPIRLMFNCLTEEQKYKIERDSDMADRQRHFKERISELWEEVLGQVFEIPPK